MFLIINIIIDLFNANFGNSFGAGVSYMSTSKVIL